MTDLIREAAERARIALLRLRDSSMNVQFLAYSFTEREIAVIEAALREKFTGAGLEEALPNNYYTEDDAPSQLNPAYYRPAVAALIEARVAAARQEVLEEAARIPDAWNRSCKPDDACEHMRTAATIAERIRALASSEPESEVSK